MRATSKVILGVLAVAAAGVVAAQSNDYKLDGLPEALKLAIRKSDSLKFVGTRTVEFRRRGDTVRITEYVTRDGQRIRLEFPEGSDFAGQVIVENASERKHYLPATNEIRILPPRKDESVSRILRFLQKSNRPYRVEETAGETVAGRRTRLVAIADSKGNVAERLYIDPSNGTILKRLFFDPVGTRVGSMEYTKIDFRRRIDSGLFTINRKGAKVISPFDEVRRISAELGFPVVFLRPETGAKLESVKVLQPMGKKAMMQTYSAKGGRYSFFQIDSRDNPEPPRRPGDNALKVTRWSTGDRSFMFVGPAEGGVYDRLATALKRLTSSND